MWLIKQKLMLKFFYVIWKHFKSKIIFILFVYLFLFVRMASQLRRDVNTLAEIRHHHIIETLGYVMENHRLCQIQNLMPHGSLDQTMMKILIPWMLKSRIAFQVIFSMCCLNCLILSS